MTRTELSDVDRRLAKGPRLVPSAVLGAGVGALVGWLAGRPVPASMGQGAAGGVALGLLLYGYSEWASSAEHKKLGTMPGDHFAGVVAPYPLHAHSVTYPWSAH